MVEQDDNNEVIIDSEVEELEEVAEQDDQENNDAQSESDEVVVSIGDAPIKQDDDDASAPEWVRKLRKDYRELKREKRELEEKLKTSDTKTVPAIGKEPELEDFDYDTDKFKKAMGEWYDKKRVVDEQEKKIKEEQENDQKAWQEKLGEYAKHKSELKVPDYDDAESAVKEMLSVTQQGIIVKGAKNPALVVFALGKNEGKLKELAAIKDPIKFAFECANLENQLKVTQKKTPPAPEKTVSGSARSSGAIDSTLERLRAEAEKTGDMTKVIAYKRQKKA